MTPYHPTGNATGKASVKHPEQLKPARRKWSTADRVAFAGTAAGIVGTIVAVAAWQWPKAPAEATNQPVPATARTNSIHSNGGIASPEGRSGSTVEYLDGGAFAAEAGSANLVALPRAVRNRQDYAAHSIVIKCPSNQTGDQVSDVTYVLHGRYGQFDADVHPYYPAGSDTKSATYVTALIGVRQPDGTLATTQTGIQQRASMGTPAALSAPVDDAEKLTLRVQCGDPNGTVALTDARLEPS